MNRGKDFRINALGLGLSSGLGLPFSMVTISSALLPSLPSSLPSSL